jgi:hypothetical protein
MKIFNLVNWSLFLLIIILISLGFKDASLLSSVIGLLFIIHCFIYVFSKKHKPLEKFLVVAWTVFVVAILYKILHYPGGDYLTIAGCLLLFIHSIIFLIKNATTNLALSFVHVTFSFWSIYLLFRVLFWDYEQTMAILAVLITIACVVLHIINRTNLKIPQYLLMVYFVFCFSLSFVHAYRVFYFFNSFSIEHTDLFARAYLSLDRYSWFLYIGGKTDEALEANRQAQISVDNRMKVHADEEAIRYSVLIKQHQQMIMEKSWVDFSWY